MDEAIRLDPKSATAFTDRASAYKKLGRIDQAIADDTEAIRLDPHTPEFFDNRGLSYAANGEYDRAIADYNEAIRLRPQANFLTNRGDSYQFKGSLDRAIADYDRALQLNPGFYLAYGNRVLPIPRKAILIMRSPITKRRCASIRSSTRQRKASRPRGRSATSAPPSILIAYCRPSIAGLRSARSKRRSAPIRIWPGSTARSTPPTRRRSLGSTAKA